MRKHAAAVEREGGLVRRLGIGGSSTDSIGAIPAPQPEMRPFLDDGEMTELLESMPPVDFAAAYGSGALEQHGYKYDGMNPTSLPMLDLMLGVEDPAAWHADNLRRNVSHYSGLARLVGAAGIARLQEGFGARLYYNTSVPVSTGSHRGRLMKYGVISLRDLSSDLLEWRWLYAAGRLHKPVRMLRHGPDDTIAAARANLIAAACAALLTLPAAFTAGDFYKAVAGLSYAGDFRMRFGGENPDKVENIVLAGAASFDCLYMPLLRDAHIFPGVCPLPASPSARMVARPRHSLGVQGAAGGKRSPAGGDEIAAAGALAEAARAMGVAAGAVAAEGAAVTAVRFEQDITSAAWRQALLGALPLTVGEAAARLVSSGATPSHALQAALAAVVAQSSRWQGAKGLLTAGLAKSAAYAFAKMRKAAAARGQQRLAVVRARP